MASPSGASATKKSPAANAVIQHIGSSREDRSAVRVQRELHSAGGSLARAAVQLDSAPMGGYDATGDAQAQADAALVAAARPVHAVETVEDVRQVLGGYADAGVPDADSDPVALWLGSHLDVAAVRRV